MNDQPTIFHITHPKAGSQWVKAVLEGCASERFIVGEFNPMRPFLEEPLKLGNIYTTIYLSWRQCNAITTPRLPLAKDTYEILKHIPFDHRKRLRANFVNWINFRILGKPQAKFLVIRDLRDTLVSLYFSLKFSHKLSSKNHVIWRNNLNRLDKDDGLIYLMDVQIQFFANIQNTWLDHTNEFVLFKYETLISDEHTTFEQIIDCCQIDICRDRLHEVVEQHSFVTIAGRQPGEEDVQSHHRKGIAGDWRNHFSDRVKEEFKQRFGKTLIKTGYESNLDW